MSRRIEGHGGLEAKTDLAQVTQLVWGEAELESSPTSRVPPPTPPHPPHPPTVMPPLGTPRQMKQTSGRTVVLAFAPGFILTATRMAWLVIFQHRPRAKVR